MISILANLTLRLWVYPVFPVCPKEHSQSCFLHEIFSPLIPFLNPPYQIVEAKDKHHNPSVRHLWHSKGSLPWYRSCFECLCRGAGQPTAAWLHHWRPILSLKPKGWVFILSISSMSRFRILWWACNPMGVTVVILLKRVLTDLHRSTFLSYVTGAFSIFTIIRGHCESICS